MKSLGRQHGTRYQHHSVLFRRQLKTDYTLELFITLVTVFTVRVGEHNFNVIITSCAEVRHNCLRPPPYELTLSSYLFAR